MTGVIKGEEIRDEVLEIRFIEVRGKLGAQILRGLLAILMIGKMSTSCSGL